MSDTEIPKSTAFLSYKVIIKCPYCDNEFDLIDYHNDDSEISKPIFNNKWEELKDFEVECDHCEKDFLIEKLEY